MRAVFAGSATSALVYDQQAVLRPVVDDGRADTRAGGDDRVGVLVLPVDGERLAGPGPEPGDERAIGRDYVVVPVRQAAGKLAHRPRLHGQARHCVEKLIQGH
jgi:hypothetical protein